MKLYLFRFRAATDTWLGRGFLINTDTIQEALELGIRAVVIDRSQPNVLSSLGVSG